MLLFDQQIPRFSTVKSFIAKFYNVPGISALFFLQSFFGFGQSADIEITLDGAETRKTADIKSEDGKKERHLLYYDGETVSGKVKIFF